MTYTPWAASPQNILSGLVHAQGQAAPCFPNSSFHQEVPCDLEPRRLPMPWFPFQDHEEYLVTSVLKNSLLGGAEVVAQW